jgi:hypothetical protein
MGDGQGVLDGECMITQTEREDVVNMLVSAALRRSSPNKPGAVVGRLLQGELGDKIRQLTSDDFRNVRIK